MNQFEIDETALQAELTAQLLRLAEERRAQAQAEARRVLAEKTRELYASGKATPDRLETLRQEYRRKEAEIRATISTDEIEAALPQAEQTVQAAAYRRDMLAARGNPDAVRAIKQRYQAAGLDVDAVKLFGG